MLLEWCSGMKAGARLHFRWQKVSQSHPGRWMKSCSRSLANMQQLTDEQRAEQRLRRWSRSLVQETSNAPLAGYKVEMETRHVLLNVLTRLDPLGYKETPLRCSGGINNYQFSSDSKSSHTANPLA